MSITELGHKLFYDLKDLKLPVDEVVIYLRPYRNSNLIWERKLKLLLVLKNA